MLALLVCLKTKLTEQNVIDLMKRTLILSYTTNLNFCCGGEWDRKIEYKSNTKKFFTTDLHPYEYKKFARNDKSYNIHIYTKLYGQRVETFFYRVDSSARGETKNPANIYVYDSENYIVKEKQKEYNNNNNERSLLSVHYIAYAKHKREEKSKGKSTEADRNVARPSYVQPLY